MDIAGRHNTNFLHESAPSAANNRNVITGSSPYNIINYDDPEIPSAKRGFKESPLKETAILFVIFIAYSLSGKLGLQLAFENASATAVWAPTGIALAAFLLRGYYVWPAILAGAFLINITTTGNIQTSALIAVGNTCEGLLGAYLVNKYADGMYAFERTSNIFRFAFLAGIISTALSATIGVTSLALWDLAQWTNYFSIWLTWWIGDAVGALILTPLLILWFQKKPIIQNSRNSIETIAAFLTLGIILVIEFSPFSIAASNNYPLSFILIPPLAWIAYRFNKRFVSAAAFTMCAAAIWGTLNGHGPFAVLSQNDSLILLQAFVCTITIMTLTFASVVEEHNTSVNSETEKALELKDFVENASLGLHWAGPDGRIIWANKFELEMLGYEKDEYVGHHISEFHAHKDKISDIMGKLGNNETIDNYEAQLKCKDGSLRDVLISSNVYMKNGEFIHTRCFTKDITDKKKLEMELNLHEQALHEAERRRMETFYQLLEKLPAGAYTCNREGLITYYNEQAIKVWGRQPMLNDNRDRFCGSYKLFAGDKPLAHDECWMALAIKNEKGYNGEEIIIQRPDGSSIEVLAHANPIHDKAGELIGAVNVLVDISEQKKILRALEESYSLMEEKVIERTEQLRKAHEELIHSEKLASLGRFSAGIAHEIRNPLANISSLSQLLLRKNSDSEIGKHLQHIHANSDIANNIIKDLLNIASPHNVNFKSINIGSMIENVCNCAEARCIKNQITLVKDIQKDIPDIMANEIKLEAAFLNLISNSIEAMPKGGTLKVTAGTNLESGEIVISFNDTGIGIPAANVDKILEPFFTTKHEGTGLGLSLVYEVIKAHSGNITFESDTKKGTEFTVRLPINKAVSG
jgi:two-component system, LuxR family, sensor kinase FixL